MIKLFLSVTVATAFMGLVACKPTSTSSTTVTRTNEATQTPTTATESTGTGNEATRTPTSRPPTLSLAPKKRLKPPPRQRKVLAPLRRPMNRLTPAVTTEDIGTVATESTGTVTEYTPGEVLILKTEAGRATALQVRRDRHIRDFRWESHRRFENQKRFEGSRSLPR